MLAINQIVRDYVNNKKTTLNKIKNHFSNMNDLKRVLIELTIANIVYTKWNNKEHIISEIARNLNNLEKKIKELDKSLDIKEYVDYINYIKRL